MCVCVFIMEICWLNDFRTKFVCNTCIMPECMAEELLRENLSDSLALQYIGAVCVC